MNVGDIVPTFEEIILHLKETGKSLHLRTSPVSVPFLGSEWML